jgi:hypothetical protein
MVRGMSSRGLTWMSALRAGTAVGSAATDGVLFGFSTLNMKGLRQQPAPTALRRCNRCALADPDRPFLRRHCKPDDHRAGLVGRAHRVHRRPLPHRGAMTILRETARILTGEPTASAQRELHTPRSVTLVTAVMTPRYQPARARSDPPGWHINDLAQCRNGGTSARMQASRCSGRR